MTLSRERLLALLSLFGALLALAVAVGSERFGGLVPCALCLVERWPYRVAAGLAVLALLAPPRLGRLLLALLVLAVLAGAAAAFVHVGVEQGWWPSPLPECAAPRFQGGSIAERLAHMPVRPAKPCDDPTYLIPGLRVSMAALNLIYALGFAGFVAMSLRSGRRRVIA
jgi:disulfide bond formation protein DsbB